MIMADRLFVNDLEIELDSSNRNAITINGLNLGKITEQRANYSNRIRIPETQQNLFRLGFPEGIDTEGRICYKLPQCSFWKQGFQVVPDGILRIDDVADEMDATVFSAETGVFKLLKGLELSDLDLSSANHFWNMDNVDEYAGTAVGEFNPIYLAINYGKNPVTGGDWNYQYLFPGWFLWDLVTLCFREQGYEPLTPADWAFESGDDLFGRLVIPFSNKTFENGSVYVAEHTFEAQTNGTDTTVNFDYENLSGSLENVDEIQVVNVHDETTGNSNYSNPNFTEPNASKIRVYGEFRVSAFTYSFVDVPPADPPTSVHYIAFVKNGTTIVHTEQIGSDNSLSLATYRTDAEIQLAQSDTLSLAFVTSIESLALGDEVHVDATLTDAVFYTQSVQTEIFPEGWIEAAEQLPTIKQSELILFAANLIGAYIVADPAKKLWTFKPFKDIATAKGSALNWDSKVVRKKGQKNWYLSKKTKPDGFFQDSQFNWIEDETVPGTLGNGSFALDNEHLDKSGDFLSNIFAASEQRITTGESMVYIEKWNADDEANDIKPRLVLQSDDFVDVELVDADSGGSSFGTVSLPVSKFSEPGLAIGSLSWSGIKSRYWEELTNSLNDFVELEVYLTLTANDIASIIAQYQTTTEPIVPIFIRGFYWVIKQVKDYRDDQFSRVILQKIE